MNLRLVSLLNENQSQLKAQLDTIQQKAEIMSCSSADGLRYIRNQLNMTLELPDEDKADNTSLEDLNTHLRTLFNTMETTRRETEILEQLYFEDIFAREDTIDNPAYETFEWLLAPEGDEGDQGDEDDAGHLTDSDNVMDEDNRLGYSGASLNDDGDLQDDTQPQENTQSQEDGQSGYETDESAMGVRHEASRKFQNWLASASDQFRKEDIKEAFHRLVEGSVSLGDVRICLFIDGLDEYSTSAYDHRKLALNIRKWTRSDHVKMCVSSRPHVEFADSFNPETRLHLHDLTFWDIRCLAEGMFRADPNFYRIHNTYHQLVEVIVYSAEGVILWAVLVLKLVIAEVGLHSPLDRLLEKIRTVPRELSALYDRLLSTLDERDRHRVNLMLLLVISSLFPPPVIFFLWLDHMLEPQFPTFENTYQFTPSEVMDRMDSIDKLTTSLTKGLLIIHDKTKLSPASSRAERIINAMVGPMVGLSHRSVRDYLVDSNKLSQIKETFESINLNTVYSNLSVVVVATAIRSLNELKKGSLQASEQAYWRLVRATEASNRADSRHYIRDYLPQFCRAVDDEGQIPPCNSILLEQCINSQFPPPAYGELMPMYPERPSLILGAENMAAASCASPYFTGISPTACERSKRGSTRES
ncbi:unnamed protein product [Parascedosporium putredinis]|uniref:Uncharacterized protein n=1 Tax=Parascedosporium putredinis TaxID=1442378 RepID=A0A9P1H229_9PEZI|nr:unnamed protein product [Parascedosporium putredinis]CAI7994225.1 unnamed protein product [Parascedosporium putredinis]